MAVAPAVGVTVLVVTLVAGIAATRADISAVRRGHICPSGGAGSRGVLGHRYGYSSGRCCRVLVVVVVRAVLCKFFSYVVVAAAAVAQAVLCKLFLCGAKLVSYIS
jgi:hypothetical protein